MFHAVIFDLDGTLLNTIEDLADAGNHVLSVLGYATHPVEDYKAMVGDGVPKLVERFLPASARGGSIQKMALQMFMNHYAAHSADKTAPYPGIEALLRALHEGGVRLGVLSNKENTLTQQVIERYFPDMFHAVSGHVLGTPTKPDPQSALTMWAELGASAEETLYVGDSPVDMQTAKNAGLTACGVLWGYRTQAQLEEAGANYIATTSAGLIKLIVGGGAPMVT